MNVPFDMLQCCMDRPAVDTLQMETPPEGGVGLEMLSPAGLMRIILKHLDRFVNLDFARER